MTNSARRPASSQRRLSRRSALKAIAALSVAGATARFATPAIAQGLKPVKLTLPWLANGGVALALRILLPITLEPSGERYRYYAMSLFFPLERCASGREWIVVLARRRC